MQHLCHLIPSLSPSPLALVVTVPRLLRHWLRRSVADASSSSCGIGRARRPRAPLRNGAREPSAVEGAMAEDDVVYPITGSNSLIAARLRPEDDDDTCEDAAALLGIDVGSDSAPIDLDGGSGEGSMRTRTTVGSNSNSTGAVDTSSVGKRKSVVWADFDEIYENANGKKVCTKAICRICKQSFSARSNACTGHIIRHQKSCRQKVDRAARVQSRLAFNPDGSVHNWDYKPAVARSELCRLIARLDLPLGIGETQAWEEYIVRAHNPRFVKVSRQTTTRDIAKLFTERRDVLKNSVLSAASSVALTSDIWCGNTKEDYISVVAHYVNADWELQKKVIGLRLIEVSHSGENIASRIAAVVEEYGLIDKIFSVTLDNASFNARAMNTLTLMFAGYLGPDPSPVPDNPGNRNHSLVHQRCACHVINLIVKSGLKRLKPYTEDFRTAISFLNSSNQRIAMFKNYCIAQGVRPRKFGLDMDVRWNATYLMLKHLVPYQHVFTVFINSNYGSQLLSANHWYVAGKILEFLELFYDSTVVLSGVYYPTSPLILHHILEIASHLHACERDQNLTTVVHPMKLKFLKYWQDIPLLYSYAFILDPRGKMRGFFNVLQLLAKYTGSEYSSYYAEVKTEIYKLFNKYENKFGAARSQRAAQLSSHTGKKKQAWGRIFGDGGTGVVGPSPAYIPTLSSSAVVCELSVYLDSDNVTDYEDDFDILLWWRDHKLTYPILSIMARDIMAAPVSTISSESCFSLTGRIIEERRQRLLPETVEMLTCIKDWELGERREQHSADNQDLEDYFKNLYLDED